jgi:hypothetical protein
MFEIVEHYGVDCCLIAGFALVFRCIGFWNLDFGFPREA